MHLLSLHPQRPPPLHPSLPDLRKPKLKACPQPLKPRPSTEIRWPFPSQALVAAQAKQPMHPYKRPRRLQRHLNPDIGTKLKKPLQTLLVPPYDCLFSWEVRRLMRDDFWRLNVQQTMNRLSLSGVPSRNLPKKVLLVLHRVTRTCGFHFIAASFVLNVVKINQSGHAPMHRPRSI